MTKCIGLNKKKSAVLRALFTSVVLLVVLFVFIRLEGLNDFSDKNKTFVFGCMIVSIGSTLIEIRLPKILHIIGEVISLLSMSVLLFFRLEPMVNDFTEYKNQATLFNVLLILGVVLVAYAIFGQNAAWGAGIGGFIVFLFYIADFFVIQFRGTPILFSDILSWRTAAGVMGGYSFLLNGTIVITFYMMTLIVSFASIVNDNNKSKAERILMFLLPLITGVFIYIFLIQTDTLKNKELSTMEFLPLKGANENGLFVNDVLTTKASLIEVPEGYSTDKVKAIMSKYSTDNAEIGENVKKPNIIVIMNESFTDLSYLETVETTEPTIPKFKSISDTCIKGTLISSILGGNTPNSEFECLTGCSMAFLPTGMVVYQQMIDRSLPTMASFLKDLGYSNTAVHLYNPEYFDRSRIYPLLGFDEFVNIYNSSVDVELFRDLATDESSFNQIIDIYEKKEVNDPMFAFCVTIQNHGGYYWQVYNIRVTNGNSGYADEYASILKITDDAFADFIEYFSNEDEPTLIVMFGDHQPFLFDDFYDSIWKDADYSEDEKRYMQAKTPFVIWSNFGVENIDMGEMSVNYLGPTIMKAAGLPMSDYYCYLDSLRETLPVICAIGFKDKDGTYFTEYEDSEYSELINEYRYLQYYYLKGNGNMSFFGVGN